jgi:hypothetical protein
MEGIFEQSQEYFIFFKSSSHIISAFASLRADPTLPDIASIYSILRSKIFDQLMANEVTQIHLILSNDDNKLYRVYRFKKGHLANSRIGLMTEIRKSINNINSKPFWTLAKTHIPTLEL